MVVGSGPNGLAAALTLAAEGIDVTVLEAADRLGGGLRSSELTLPGLIHDECSAAHPLAVDTPFSRRFDLEAHGLTWRWAEVEYAHPLDGGSGGAAWRSVSRTAEGLGRDGRRWRSMFGPLSERFGDITGDFMRPMLHRPERPLELTRFGAYAAMPADLLARRWRTAEAQALFAGVAAHSFRPFSEPMSSAIGVTLGTAAHRYGWPVAEGGSQAICRALVSMLGELGADLQTGVRVASLAELGSPDIVMLDLAPAAAARIAADRMPRRVARALTRYRHGPGAFKVDFAVAEGIPWAHAESRRAGTVHVGGSRERIAAAERMTCAGRMPEQPFVLVCQQSLADPTRAQGDAHPVYAYAHVPAGYTGDATEAIIGQIERFAPGFRERILAQHVRSAPEMEAYNPNYVGGDIVTGSNDPRQLVFRPRAALDPYTTGIPGVYLCSAATPPGAGAHGMCGYNAAQSALRRLDREPTLPGRRAARVVATRPLAPIRRTGRGGGHRVVIIGGGFGGLAAAKGLAGAAAQVTLVDRRNFHLFQPLLYQVATGSLSPGEIASPLRSILKRQANAKIVMAEVTGIDLENRRVLLGHQAHKAESGELGYDTLVVAAGARHSFFGRDEWEQYAPGMKTVEHALRIRRRMLMAFEAAELEADPAQRRAWLNFVVIGAGPTGVELAGQIAEIANYTLKRDFRDIDPREAEVMLIEANERVLPAYVPRLSARAARSLAGLGVAVMPGKRVIDMDWESVTVLADGGEPEQIPARTKIWAAGVQASPLSEALAQATGADLDRSGRVTVAPDLTLPGHPEVFVIGDMNRVSDGAGGVQPWPGVAQPAMQEGRYAAAAIQGRLDGHPPRAPFTYRDKGSLATIGRLEAVADVGGHQFGGAPAWLTWIFVHILFLAGLQNRTVVLLRWVLSFLSRGRAQRLMTGESVAADYERTSRALLSET
ncbi:MAG TPA: FAD-dependent oxidoreductase [Solirubrobacteraceae bacterium]|nr:FAD-dependent oxidoreductase [Solirubrobacteraceae bacterium]